MLELTCWIKFCFHGKLGYYKVSQQEFGFLESIPGIIKGKNQVVGYGKQLK
jgi:regulator of sigma E protease